MIYMCSGDVYLTPDPLKTMGENIVSQCCKHLSVQEDIEFCTRLSKTLGDCLAVYEDIYWMVLTGQLSEEKAINQIQSEMPMTRHPVPMGDTLRKQAMTALAILRDPRILEAE